MDAELEARIADLEAKVNELSRLAATPGILEATRIRIVDHAGKPVAVLGTGMNGGSLTLLDQDTPTVHLSANKTGGLAQLFSADGESVVGLGSDQYGGLISVCDMAGRAMVGFAVDSLGGVAQALSRVGECVATMRTDEDGGLLEARNLDGETVASIAVVDDGGLMQIRNHDGGTVASMSSVSTGGRLALHDSHCQDILALGGGKNGGRIEVKNPPTQQAKAVCLSETGCLRLEGANNPDQAHEPGPQPTASPREVASLTTEIGTQATADSPTQQTSITDDPNHHETMRVIAKAVERDIAKIKDIPDIVEVISASVELQADGCEFRGNCPFHEDTAQLMCVVPLMQVFYCYGCSAGGSAITFVQEHHNLSFEEAVAVLAIRRSNESE